MEINALTHFGLEADQKKPSSLVQQVSKMTDNGTIAQNDMFLLHNISH